MQKNPKHLKQKDVLLLLSNKFDSKDSNLIGYGEENRNLSTYFVSRTSEAVSQVQLGKFANNVFTLKGPGSKEQQIVHNEALPVDPPGNGPLITCLSYDEQVFSQSELIGTDDGKPNNCFESLHSKFTQSRVPKTVQNPFEPIELFISVLYLQYFQHFGKVHSFLSKSHWYTHVASNMSSLYANYRAHNCRGSRIITRNLYSTKIFDFLLGLIALHFLLEHQAHVWDSILQTTKYVIDELKYVLDVLMGSPAGLKLNCALNQTLGIFFFYHISLWKAFIESIFFVSSSIVYGFLALGSLGLSYQIALCADVIMFLTFHVYCIYVYAARLFKVQMYAITSLWRLFIGRKYNPLKNRVDSFQYSHNQLFVGTLGFTVLLFLLPTTFLYYIVFTMFRIVVLIACKVMFRIATTLSSTPLYLLFLRLTGSSRIKGTIRMYATKDIANSTLQLHTSMDLLDHWFRSAPEAKSSVSEEAQTGRSLNEYFRCVCTGNLL